MPENLDRLSHPKMEYYRHVYKNSERWNGSDNIDGKTVVVYCEQGFGDIIQFSRYIPALKERCGHVIMHCPQALHRLFEQYGVELLDKFDENVPKHDYHVCSMSLPFVLEQIEVPVPYLKVDEAELIDFDGVKIGIAWEGNPEHSNNDERNCPLRHFFTLALPKTQLYMVQKEIHIPELIDGAETMNLMGAELNDFYDTAKLLNSMDFVVSVDTSVVHLAGAMGVPTFVMLSHNHDPRWEVANWYPSLTFIKQCQPNSWLGTFDALMKKLTEPGGHLFGKGM